MGKYIVKRLLEMIPMLFLVSVLVFLGTKMMPIDPINVMFGPDVTADPLRAEALREELGLNDPIFIQYFNWLKQVLQGNLGHSITLGRPVLDIIIEKIPATLQLTFVGFLIATILGVVMGIICARFPDSWFDNLSRLIAIIGDSAPQFIIGYMLIYIFSVKLGWLPASGRLFYGENAFISSMRSLVLPASALSFGMISAVLRYTRNSVMAVMNDDYIKTAVSKGLSERKIYFKHGFRNALGPVLVLSLLRIPGLLGGSVVIESVFSWPGMGAVILSAISASDYPLLLGTTLILATLILLVSVLMDVLNAWLNPKVRLEG